MTISRASLPQNLVLDLGTLLNDFDDATNVTVTTGTAAGDNSKYVFGNGSCLIKQTSSTSTLAKYTLPSALDLSNLSFFEVCVYMQEKSMIYDFRLDLYTSSGNYYYKYVDTFTFRNGWNRFRVRLKDMTKNGSPVIGNITAIEVRASNAINTKCMLHMNTNTLADSLGTPKTITNNGATYDTNTYLFGSGSYYFGAGSYVSIAQHADFAYGNGSLADYCIDFRYYPKSLSATGVKLYSQIKDANNQLDFTLKNDGNLYITWIDNGTTYLSGTIPLAPTLNQWNHVSISKNWGYVRVFLNGLLQGQQLISVAANVGTYTGIPVIFSAADATGGATGYIQEYRTSKGVPRHVTNFTPETAVYTIPDTARTDTPDMNNPTIVDTYARFNIDKTSYNSKGLTKILFTFDDAWQVTYDNALPILNNYGFKGTTWAISDFVQGSDPNYMRASSLLSLYNTYNWDIGNHSKDHSDVIGQLPTASQILEYQTCYNFLISLGFTRSAAHVCYPSGNYSDSLISALKSIGMLTGRTTNGYLQTNIFPTASANDELFKLRCFALGSSTTPQNVYDKIDEAIDVGSTLMFMIHRIVPTPAQSIEFSTTNLDLVCQYIRAKRLDVVTISEWYNMLTNPRKVVSRI